MKNFFFEVIFTHGCNFFAPLNSKYHIYVYLAFKFIISEVESFKNFWSGTPPHRVLGGGVQGRTDDGQKNKYYALFTT